MLGPEPEDDKEVSILNRVIRWCEDCLLYEADPRHVEKLLRNADLEKCNAMSTPGIKESSDLTCDAWFEESGLGHGEVGDSVVTNPPSDNPEVRLLDRSEMREYRSVVARCNYLAQDRFEIAFTTKELCRAMAEPTVSDSKAIIRLCRFLKGVPRLVQRIPFMDHPRSLIEVYVDSDWAGCRKSRKSTSGGVLMFGGATVRGWSTTQSVIALSSGEAEYHAALKGASVALGFQSMLADLGIVAKIILYSGSSAARALRSLISARRNDQNLFTFGAQKLCSSESLLPWSECEARIP